MPKKKKKAVRLQKREENLETQESTEQLHRRDLQTMYKYFGILPCCELRKKSVRPQRRISKCNTMRLWKGWVILHSAKLTFTKIPKYITWNEKELLGHLEAVGIISASKIFFFSFGKLKLWCPMYLPESWTYWKPMQKMDTEVKIFYIAL